MQVSIYGSRMYTNEPTTAGRSPAVCHVRMMTSPTLPIACESEEIMLMAPMSCKMSSAAIVSCLIRLKNHYNNVYISSCILSSLSFGNDDNSIQWILHYISIYLHVYSSHPYKHTVTHRKCRSPYLLTSLQMRRLQVWTCPSDGIPPAYLGAHPWYSQWEVGWGWYWRGSRWGSQRRWWYQELWSLCHKVSVIISYCDHMYGDVQSYIAM